MKKLSLQSNFVLLIFTAFGIITPLLGVNSLINIAHVVTTLFIKTLKTISLPILFLSLASTLSSMKSMDEMRKIGRKVLFYTFSTTAAAACIALLVFMYLSPYLTDSVANAAVTVSGKNYLEMVLELFPSNFIQPFATGNAFGVVLISFALGIATQFLPASKKDVLHAGFDALFSVFLLIAKGVTLILPIAAWAFMTELMLNITATESASLHMLLIFLATIISVNLIQGVIALPLLLWRNGISPVSLFNDVSKSLSVAFFTRSSSASLPLSLDLLTNKAGISKKVSNFSLPLCSTINMNGCAQFILLSVLFSAVYCGQPVTAFGYLFWLVIAVIAAVGNAGVPMGCYFLATLLLTSAGLPLVFMGLILPFYPILDMIETAVNVWSDICITAIADKQLKEQSPLTV